MFNVSTPMWICALVWEIFLVHVRESFSLRGGIIPVFVLTVQMYGILIAVHERFDPLFFVFSDFFFSAAVTIVKVILVKIENQLSNSPTII